MVEDRSFQAGNDNAIFIDGSSAARVAAYRNKEGSYVVLAARFSISRAVVGKLVRQERE